MKKILIDVNPVVPYYISGKLSGIGRTTRELVLALDKQENLPFEIQLYSQNMKGIGGRNLQTHFKCHHLYLPNREKFNKLSASFHCREFLTGYDLMHITHNFEYVAEPERCIVTIHDVMFFSYPEAFLGHDKAKALYPKLAKRAKAIITCSENSKNEIAQYMGVERERIFVAPWGVDHTLFYPQNVSYNRFTGNVPFFIAVSCDIGRKNTIAVLRAFRKFSSKRTNHVLVLVWRKPPLEIINEFEDLIAENKLFFVSNIDDKELSELYAMATVSFFPSKYEGFGLPILESMASGTPVVTCRNSSLEEVGGEAAIYVSPDDVDYMCDIMLQFENGNINYDEIRQLGINQAAGFTWDRCAKLTIDVYKRCLDL